MTKFVHHGSWYLMYTTTHYTSLYIKKKNLCLTTERSVVTVSSDGNIREDGQSW
jgi:hypothetical protein